MLRYKVITLVRCHGFTMLPCYFATLCSYVFILLRCYVVMLLRCLGVGVKWVNLQIQGAPFFSADILCIETESEEIFSKKSIFGGLHPLFVNQNFAKI